MSVEHNELQQPWFFYLLMALIVLATIEPLINLIFSKAISDQRTTWYQHQMNQLAYWLIILLKPVVPLTIYIAMKCAYGRFENKGIRLNDKSQLRAAGRLTNILVEKKALVSGKKETAGFILASPA